MKRLIIGVTAALALMLPVSAIAVPSPTDFKNAAKFCKALRADMGAVAFKQTYGTNGRRSNALGKCVSRQARAENAAHKSAVQDCKAERLADPAAFKDKYGSNGNKNNAFGKCVSAQAKAAADARQEALVGAAKDCRTERAADPSAFKEKYGTNRNNANAFGKCVSKTARSAPSTDTAPTLG